MISIFKRVFDWVQSGPVDFNVVTGEWSFRKETALVKVINSFLTYRIPTMNQQKLQEQQRVQKALGEQIRNLRLKKGWSQKLLAELSGIDPRAIAQIEHGEFEVRLSTLAALAAAFHITGSRLVGGIL